MEVISVASKQAGHSVTVVQRAELYARHRRWYPNLTHITDQQKLAA
jgi:hypothetical protein